MREKSERQSKSEEVMREREGQRELRELEKNLWVTELRELRELERNLWLRELRELVGYSFFFFFFFFLTLKYLVIFLI